MITEKERPHFALGRACSMCKLSLKLHTGCPVLEKKDSPKVALRNSQIGVWIKKKEITVST